LSKGLLCNCTTVGPALSWWNASPLLCKLHS